MNLPVEFVSRMKQMLGAEAGAFLDSYAAPARRGLRINPMKISAAEFAKRAPFPVEPVPWARNGFYYPDNVRPAQHPWYRAGLYYLQEPSAMTPADRLPVSPGERVLDLCAAPGGKSTQLAGRLNGDGSLLTANEISNARAKALLRNLELFGAAGCFVTNERADRLAEAFPEYFDKILVDAPCSGEGMFRRQPEVASHWSAERVQEFAGTQRRILEEAVKMLRPGGMLMYSTCTFSIEENEGSTASFLVKHPEMQLVDIAPYEGFDTGHPEWLGDSRIEADRAIPEETASALTKCVRIWPHKMGGEGHFLALMCKTGSTQGPAGDESAAVQKADMAGGRRKEKSRQKRERAGRQGSAVNVRGKRAGDAGAARETILQQFLDDMGITLPAGKIDCRRDRMYLVPELPVSVQGLQFLRSGVFLGEVRKDRFVPAQPFAMILNAGNCGDGCSVSFAPDDPRLPAYLSGQTLTPEEPAALSKGWKLVCVDGFGLGWAHFAGGVLKNKYPVSWR